LRLPHRSRSTSGFSVRALPFAVIGVFFPALVPSLSVNESWADGHRRGSGRHLFAPGAALILGSSPRRLSRPKASASAFTALLGAAACAAPSGRALRPLGAVVRGSAGRAKAGLLAVNPFVAA
jgi:hypothetical protein